MDNHCPQSFLWTMAHDVPISLEIPRDDLGYIESSCPGVQQISSIAQLPEDHGSFPWIAAPPPLVSNHSNLTGDVANFFLEFPSGMKIQNSPEETNAVENGPFIGHK